jgi:sodium-dependent dicarboxylate transporter 2/3/5
MKVNFRMLSIIAGPAGAIVLFFLTTTMFINASGDAVENAFALRATIAIMAWMAFWWISEAVPMAATALLPVTLFPLLGLIPFKAAAQAYAHPLIFLFFGGFLISIAVQKWGLHRRFAVSLLRRIGDDPARLIGGFMLATAFLSMWLSNTATTIMMLPIALSVVGTRTERDDMAKCLLLAIAYSASIGGMATLIGTPPNLYVASFLSDAVGREISFLNWMVIGVPCTAVLLPSAWYYLTKIHFSIPERELPDTAALDGPGISWIGLGVGARSTLVIFAVVVLGWVGRPWISEMHIFGGTPFQHLSDAGVVLMGALALFLIPVDIAQRKFVLEWSDTRDLPWGTLILFGGGLSLAATITATGTDRVFGLWVAQIPTVSALLLVFVVVALVIILTELTSNIATTATLVPVLAASAPVLGVDVEMIAMIVALAASCAFMLPVATPPNAIIFANGRLRAAEMAATGLAMNGLALLVITIVGYTLIPFIIT